MPAHLVSQSCLSTLVALTAVTSAVAGAMTLERAQPPAPTGLRFETASVKRAAPGERGRVFGFTPQAGRVRLVNLTFGTIVRAAFGVEFPHSIPEERVSGGPEWMESDRFTIEATAGSHVAQDAGPIQRVSPEAERTGRNEGHQCS